MWPRNTTSYGPPNSTVCKSPLSVCIRSATPSCTAYSWVTGKTTGQSWAVSRASGPDDPRSPGRPVAEGEEAAGEVHDPLVRAGAVVSGIHAVSLRHHATI